MALAEAKVSIYRLFFTPTNCLFVTLLIVCLSQLHC